jgi:PAS domain-containing protein
MMADPAYVIAGRDGRYIAASQGALALLGIDIDRLRDSQIDDYFNETTADAIRGLVRQRATPPDRWLGGVTHLRKADGTVVRVRYAAFPQASGELVTRLYPEPAKSERPVQLLDAWRRQERTLASLSPGSAARARAEAEADRLRVAYQRVVLARVHEGQEGSR